MDEFTVKYGFLNYIVKQKLHIILKCLPLAMTSVITLWPPNSPTFNTVSYSMPETYTR